MLRSLEDLGCSLKDEAKNDVQAEGWEAKMGWGYELLGLEAHELIWEHSLDTKASPGLGSWRHHHRVPGHCLTTQCPVRPAGELQADLIKDEHHAIDGVPMLKNISTHVSTVSQFSSTQ